jgi:hypothetical protein
MQPMISADAETLITASTSGAYVPSVRLIDPTP